MNQNTISHEEISQKVRTFAKVAADAYANQYMGGRQVMNMPVVYYNTETGAFGWCSSLTPLSAGEVVIETIEEGIYGETGEDAEIAREAIEAFITEEIDLDVFLGKIFPDEDETDF